MVRNGQSFFYHADGLGSIVAITDSTPAVVQQYAYDAFGMLTPSNPEFANTYSYTGREWDQEIGLYYYRARYYDPMEGRFISKDPIGFAGGDVNLYRYVQNSPANWVDPSGLWTFNLGAYGTAGAGAGAVVSAGFVVGISFKHGIQFGTYESYGGGGMGGVTAGTGIEVGVSANTDINCLRGTSARVGGSYTIAGVDVDFNGSSLPVYSGNLTIPVPSPSELVPELHGYVVKTEINEITNRPYKQVPRSMYSRHPTGR